MAPDRWVELSELFVRGNQDHDLGALSENPVRQVQQARQALADLVHRVHRHHLAAIFDNQQPPFFLARVVIEQIMTFESVKRDLRQIASAAEQLLRIDYVFKAAPFFPCPGERSNREGLSCSRFAMPQQEPPSAFVGSESICQPRQPVLCVSDVV